MAEAKAYHDRPPQIEQVFRYQAPRAGVPAGGQLEALPKWRRCDRRGCQTWTRGKFCPRHGAVGRP